MKRSRYWILVAVFIFLSQYFFGQVYFLSQNYPGKTLHKSLISKRVTRERIDLQKDVFSLQTHGNDSRLEEFRTRDPADITKGITHNFGYTDYPDDDEEMINPFPFKPVLVPTDPCLDPELYVFLFIYTAPKNYKDRLLIRETWGDKSQYSAKVGYLFFMGLQENTTKPSHAVLEEHNMYDDIYVKDYVDSYFNLSHKGMSGMRYASQHCSHVRRIVRTDDDVLIDIFHLIKFFQSERKKNYS